MATFESISPCNFVFLLAKLLVFSMNEPRFTKSYMGHVVVGHTFNLNTREVEAGGSL